MAKKNKENKKTKKKIEKSRGERFYLWLREWTDAFVFAFFLAMLIRTFVVELYQIPTGSMTPTLVGGLVKEKDWDNDGDDDLLIIRHVTNPGGRGRVDLVFLKEGDEYKQPPLYVFPEYKYETGLNVRNDRILVNKFAYFFKEAERGDPIVFKVPEKIFDINKPYYIKRLAGQGGEKLAIKNGDLYVNGEKVKEPEAVEKTYYKNTQKFFSPNKEVEIPEDEFYAFGDNSSNSYDSRFWGGVPYDNLKGKAFFRWWPLSKMGFIK